MPEQEQAEPRRFLLRPAGVLTQLCAAACLLLGTIAFVLVQQNKSGGLGLVVVWSLGAMAGLVFGGLMARGGLISLLAGAAIDIAFAVVLIAIDFPTLRAILRVLPESDVELVGDVLVGGAVVMLATALLCLASIGQARRYARAYQRAVEDAVATDPAVAQSFTAMRTVPPVAPTPPPMPTFGPAMPGGGTLPQPARVISPGIPKGPRTEPGMGSVVPARATDDERPTDPTTPIIPSAASTNKGWTPARTGFTTMIIVRPPQEEARSRRRIYIALAGAAIGVGAGIGVLMSGRAGGHATPASASAPGAPAGSGSSVAAKSKGGGAAAGSGAIASGSGSGAPGASGAGSAVSVAVAAPAVPVRELLAAQRKAIGKADAKALVATYAKDAFAFGIDGTDVVEGRDAIEELMNRQLGDAPPDGFRVEVKFTATGSERDVAWTAEDLELTGPGVAPRRIAITQLARFVGGAWTVAALCWGQPVGDATAERLAILGTLPRASAVPNRHDGSESLDKAVRIAFSSRAAFAAARSEREDAFNFGSGPGERVIGGVAIKRLFARLRADLVLDGTSARVSEIAPGVGWAAVNVVFTQKGQAATDVAQTFRVLAVLLEENGAWHVVQTQFSNAGPIR